MASYGHALDNGFAQADNGPAYAGLFTPDGVAFRRLKGFVPLAAIAPSPEGATGEQYLAVIDPPAGGKPGGLFLGGHYEDVYARTPQGWRFKSRRFVNESQAALKAAP